MNYIVLPCLLVMAIFPLTGSHFPDDKIGSPAPLFIGKTPDGETIRLEEYKGHVVILDIWASWCGPCREEMPFLSELDRKYKKSGLEIIAVNIDDEASNMQAFLKNMKKKPAFTIVFDPEKRVPELYDAPGMPTTVFIDKKGIIRYMQSGFRDSHKEQYVERLLTLLDAS